MDLALIYIFLTPAQSEQSRQYEEKADDDNNINTTTTTATRTNNDHRPKQKRTQRHQFFNYRFNDKIFGNITFQMVETHKKKLESWRIRRIQLFFQENFKNPSIRNRVRCSSLRYEMGTGCLLNNRVK